MVMVRPVPPADLLQVDLEDMATGFRPAPEVWEWVDGHVLDEGGCLHNPDHLHLAGADVAVLWASSSFTKQGRTVVGQAELVAFRAGGWQKGRMERQMVDWFGRVPTAVITLAADYCADCSDAEFCALVEHELYHLAQDVDQFGSPKFHRDGTACLVMRGHDVEEFVGVVRRYGASAGVQQMIDAAKGPPEVAKINIARSCGTCMLRTA